MSLARSRNGEQNTINIAYSVSADDGRALGILDRDWYLAGLARREIFTFRLVLRSVAEPPPFFGTWVRYSDLV